MYIEYVAFNLTHLFIVDEDQSPDLYEWAVKDKKKKKKQEKEKKKKNTQRKNNLKKVTVIAQISLSVKASVSSGYVYMMIL